VEVVVMATTKAKTKKALKEKKDLWLVAYYGMKSKRSGYEQAGNVGMVESIDNFLAVCVEKLWILRGQEVLTWPLLLPAVCSREESNGS
jgi:hypothetical protein